MSCSSHRDGTQNIDIGIVTLVILSLIFFILLFEWGLCWSKQPEVLACYQNNNRFFILQPDIAISREQKHGSGSAIMCLLGGLRCPKFLWNWKRGTGLLNDLKMSSFSLRFKSLRATNQKSKYSLKSRLHLPGCCIAIQYSTFGSDTPILHYSSIL